jgi:hypothetical protein
MIFSRGGLPLPAPDEPTVSAQHNGGSLLLWRRTLGAGGGDPFALGAGMGGKLKVGTRFNIAKINF